MVRDVKEQLTRFVQEKSQKNYLAEIKNLEVEFDKTHKKKKASICNKETLGIKQEVWYTQNHPAQNSKRAKERSKGNLWEMVCLDILGTV